MERVTVRISQTDQRLVVLGEEEQELRPTESRRGGERVVSTSWNNL